MPPRKNRADAAPARHRQGARSGEAIGAEDFATWPFWKRADGLLARGRAYSHGKDGARAESDLRTAIEWISDTRSRSPIWLSLAQNRELNLNDDAGAHEAYEASLGGRTVFTSSDQFTALQGIARIQTRKRQFDEALKTLNRAEPEKLQGVWRENIQKSIEAVNTARKPQ